MYGNGLPVMAHPDVWHTPARTNV